MNTKALNDKRKEITMKRQIKKTVLTTVILVMLMMSQTVSAAPLHPLNSGPVSQFIYDNFNDNVTDASLWSVEQLGGPAVSEVNQRLEITVPADSAGAEFSAWYLSACQLRGDFDIQVDYELLTWPPANGVRISLTNDYANMERTSFGATGDFAGGPEVYLTDFGGLVKGSTATSDLSGKLRLERVGDTLTGSYFGNGGWITSGSNSNPAYTADTGFYLGSWSHDPIFADQEVKLAFDNLMISQGELICPQAPAPDLAITQVADQETVSTGDPIGFTITTANNGDATANSVTLSDTLPTAAELNWSVSGTDAAACTITAGVVSCNFGDMPPGVVKSIKLTSSTRYIVGDGFCPVISSTATVMATNQPVNKSATASTAVLCPSVYIEVLADNQDSQAIPAGDPVSFTTSFGNAGQGIARDVLAEIEIPTNPGLSWSIKNSIPAEAANNCVFGTDRFGTYELMCSFDQMTPGQEVTLTLASPTTSASCGMVNSVGYISLTNGLWARFIMKPPIITCPVGDSTPPVITPYISGMLGTNGWFTTDTLLIWSVTDPQSAINSTSGCENVSITQDEAATDYICTATSDGGTSSASVNIKRDGTKPATSVINVTEGATYTLGSVPLASCSSTDNLSGIAAEAILALTGGDAQGIGNITATCSGALDGAGNAADNAVVHYTVNSPSNTYNFTGFLQPVDNWPTENTMKAGASVAVRFSLGGDMGLTILAPGSPTSRQIACPSSSAVTADAIEETTTSNSGLTYDAVSGQYTYVWKTNKTWANTCRVFTILFADGSSQQALFRFNK